MRTTVKKAGKRKLIRDRTSEAQGFAYFSRSSVSSDGKSLLVEYPSKVAYRVPLSYLLLWYDKPHKADGSSFPSEEVRIVRSRRLFNNFLVRVDLSDGRQYDVAWDVVLMACEPLYEHYGGFTEHSKKLTKEWDNSHGSWRLERGAR